VFEPVSVSRIKMHIIRVVLVLQALCQCNAARVSSKSHHSGCAVHHASRAKEAAARESCCSTGAQGVTNRKQASAAVNSDFVSCITSHESRVTQLHNKHTAATPRTNQPEEDFN
jgi:hypothetical protein